MDVSAGAVERSVRRSTAFDRLVRWGLVGYGLVHLGVGAVAVSLVVGGDRTSSQGALAHLAAAPSGVPVLVALAVGFAVLAVWQAIAGLVGYRHLDDPRRAVMRLGAGCRALTYGYLAIALVRLLVGGSGGSSPRQTSAGLLAEPFGRLLLGAGGLVVAGIGVGLVVFGVRREFLDQLDAEARTRARRVPIVALGQAGYVAKGLAYLLIGALVCWAAATDDPRRAGGLDRSLERLVRVPMGAVAVVAIGIGIACFGGYLFARARHFAPRTLTS